MVACGVFFPPDTPPMFYRLLLGLLLFGSGIARANTIINLGSVSQFTGPESAGLDLAGQFDYAINFSNDDPLRTVKGLVFKPDNQAIPGATLVAPQHVTPWQTKPEYGAAADANALEEIMHDIRWADSSSGQKLQASLAVTPGITYKLQILISGNGAENRRWDIRINGQPAVDEITSLGASPGATYATGRSTVYSYEFIPVSSPLVVEMGNLFGINDGGDRNPIWQALTLERVFIPPTPEDISLVPTSFFPQQKDYIGTFRITDIKSDATHVLTLVPGAGSADNAKFALSGGRLLPSSTAFLGAIPGSSYGVRIRATDAGDGARWLEKAFTVTLESPDPPTAVVLNATSLGAGLIGGQVAALLSAADADPVDRHSFELVAGEGSAQNSLFTIVGNELQLASALPAQTARIQFRLRATDLSGFSVETAFALPVVEPRVRINEVLAVSTAASLPLDENSQPQDWIELYNELAQPMNLSGWYLTDDPDNLRKWAFPSVPVPPQGYLVVFASGTGAKPANGPIHTNFSLSQSGETILLVRPDGQIASRALPPGLYPNTTWGIGGGGAEAGYLRNPTPGALNSPPASAGRNEVLFSVPHGYYDVAFPLTLTPSVPGSVIRYTLNGSPPTPSSPVYSGPFTITPVAGTTRSGVRIVRAVATHPDAAYSPVATQTYFFVNGVSSPAVDGIVGQTNLFASIRNHATYGPLLDDALLALPSVSLVINNSGELPFSETESSVELLDPRGGEAGFTIPAGVIRSGTSSLSFAKGSMSVRFRGEYGATQLDYPVYGRHPHDPLGAVTTFQELRLRSGSHDTHSWLGTSENPPVPYGSPPVTRSGDAQLIRNIWQEDVHLMMGQPGMHGRMVQLFVNGNYYGIYHILEHPDDDYMGSYFAGSSEDYHYTGGGTTGSVHDAESWSVVWAQIKESVANFTQAKRWIDMTNLADYMALSFYAGNDWDWTSLHNWGAAGHRLPDRGGWKFFPQDVDISLQDVDADCTDQTVPDGIFNALLAYPDFKVLWRDRIYRHFFHEGLLTPAKVNASYNLRAEEIHTAIVAETARWQPTSSVGPLPWDRNGEWTVERNYLNNIFFPQRTAKVLSQFKARGWYPVEAPEMSQRGGTVPAGSEIGLSAPSGTIYYTTDGSDPRLSGGALNPTAAAYQSSVSTVTVVDAHDGRAGRGAVWKYLVPAADPGATWMTPEFNDAAWPSGAVEAGYGEAGQITDVGFADSDPVTEGVQPNLTTYFRHRFNVANAASITGLSLRLKRDDGAVVYLNGREVMRSAMPAGVVGFTTPGNAGVNVPDDGKTWFSQVLTPSQYTLVTGANVIAVEVHNASSSSGDLIFDLELTANSQVSPQPLILGAPTVVKARARALNGDWSALNEAFFVLAGTQPAATGNITLTEIHYHPEGAGQGDAEFLEFRNTSTSPVDFSGLQLSGAVDFTFPMGAVVLPDQHIVVVNSPVLFDARYRNPASPYYRAGIQVAGAWSGSLANSGETVVVTDPGHASVFSFAWSDDGAWPGRADGSGSSLELKAPLDAPASLSEKKAWLGTPGNWRPSTEFHGSPGAAGSGPDSRVVINEVLSSSLAPSLDFIELFNPGSLPQPIGGWFLSDTADQLRKYRLPAPATLSARGHLVLTEQHFNNAADPACFFPFSLSSAGDDVFLMEADVAGNLLRFADRVEFPAAPGGMTFGRYPDGSGPLQLGRSPSAGTANAPLIPEYAAWVTSSFPPATPGTDTALDADPDQDGMTNLLEFACQLPPLIPGGSPLVLGSPTGGSPLQITYFIRQDIPGLRAILQLSSDSQNWDNHETGIERLSAISQPDGTIRVTARIKADPPAPRRFLRLAVSL